MYSPENEEILSDRLPLEEVPAEEIPAEEVPAEEAPAEEVPAEEAPAEEVPAEEVPAEEVPAEEVPAEEIPAEEVPEKKKKLLPWILGGVGLLLALAVAAACIWGINPYLAKKNAYEKAAAYLQQGDFDNARESFKAAEDYKDAAARYQDLVSKENLYSTAVAEMEKGNYAQAKEVLNALADYKDAPKLVQDCLYQMAIGYLAQQKPGEAFALREEMDEAVYQQFVSVYLGDFADQKALLAMENSLQLRYEKEQSGAASYDAVKAEQDALAALDGLTDFADTELEQLVETYRDGVALQFGALTEQSAAIENHDFYLGAYKRAQAIEKLMTEYGFLQNNEILTAAYTGSEARYEAIVSLQTALEKAFAAKQEEKGGDGKDYVPFRNTTQVAAKLRFQSVFYKGQKVVSSTQTACNVLPGETVYILAGKPKSYDSWEITWEFLDVSYGEALQLQPGTYKLESVIYEGVFYPLEAWKKAQKLDAPLRLTFRADGSGIWAENGEETSCAYSADLIAVEGTALRLGYRAAPGKLLVDLDGKLYGLTLAN